MATRLNRLRLGTNKTKLREKKPLEGNAKLTALLKAFKQKTLDKKRAEKNNY